MSCLGLKFGFRLFFCSSYLCLLFACYFAAYWGWSIDILFDCTSSHLDFWAKTYDVEGTVTTKLSFYLLTIVPSVQSRNRSFGDFWSLTFFFWERGMGQFLGFYFPFLSQFHHNLVLSGIIKDSFVKQKWQKSIIKYTHTLYMYINWIIILKLSIILSLLSLGLMLFR